MPRSRPYRRRSRFWRPLYLCWARAGLELVESLPGVEAILVTPELEIIISSGLQGGVELVDS